MARLANAALLYHPEAFQMDGPKIMGRQSASMGFLKAFLTHAQVDEYWAMIVQREHAKLFGEAVATHAPSPKPAKAVFPHDGPSLAAIGAVHEPDPILAPHAWKRIHHGPASYSLTGVTHTLCSGNALDALGDLLLAPLEPWDALICTSQTTRTVVQRIYHSWGEYLASRCGSAPMARFELPVIPLGVNCAGFAADWAMGGERAAAGRQYRTERGICDDDVVFLFVGRLSFHAKAHPLPMFLALEEAARRTGRTLWLTLCGWFANESIEAEFRQGAAKYCPSVRFDVLDGRRPEMREQAWEGADVFTSLVDNIQETFGLTPIEAMAAGLPAVVSDWDGYKETVRTGVDGFRVATLAPGPGDGGDLASRFSLGLDNYDHYIGQTSQSISVDMEETIAAYVQLAGNRELRRTMGAAARRRAETVFDWSIVIRAYQELWGALAERRAAADPAHRRPLPHPLRDDPYALHVEYPTRRLGDNTTLTTGSRTAAEVPVFLASTFTGFGAARLLPAADLARLVERVASTPSISVQQLTALWPAERRPTVVRSIGWLIKVDVLRAK